MSARARYATLAEIYAAIPHINCAGKCAASCGPILMSQAEWRAIIERVGYEPPQCEVPELKCPLLADERCTVYDIRPLICRLWGVTEQMPCVFGCKPERYLTIRETAALMDRAMALGGWPSAGPGREVREVLEAMLAEGIDPFAGTPLAAEGARDGGHRALEAEGGRDEHVREAEPELLHGGQGEGVLGQRVGDAGAGQDEDHAQPGGETDAHVDPPSIRA